MSISELGKDASNRRGRGAGDRGSWWRFASHYLEMVVAMLVGMLVIGMALSVILSAIGLGYSHAAHPAIGALEMTFTMSAGMALWMRYRGHGRASTLEMTAAMFVPLVVLFPLLWAGLISGGMVMMSLHVLMLPAMLVAMLRRRGEYATAHRMRGQRIVQVVGRGLAVLLALALVPVPVYIAGSRAYERGQYPQQVVTTAGNAAVAAATPPVHDPAKRTVAVVVGNAGANVADALVTYEVFATTGAFNTYIVAPERRPVTLLGGLELIPDLSFAQLGQRLGGSAPDVTVVPAMPDSDPSNYAAVTPWLRNTAANGLLLSVCAGADVVADAGLLDGRHATSHWYWIPELRKHYPAVDWRRGVRYVDDGNLISTGGLLSSVDGSLRAIERLLGTDAATAAAKAIGWRYYSPGKAAALAPQKLTAGDALLHTLNVGYRWDAPTLGVVLTDGVGEIELAAAFDSYAEQSLSVRTLAVGTDGTAVRSRHGLTFLPRTGLADAGTKVDRLVVPGAAAAARSAPDVAAAARRADVPVTYLNARPGFAFDGALRDVAATMDVPTARWAGKILEYPTAALGLSGSGWPWTLILRPLFLGLAGVAAGLGAVWLVRRVRTRRA
jgi:transcriptional regulator GlxA family with amidase domain